jgi:S1-C subfamily serine protease
VVKEIDPGEGPTVPDPEALSVWPPVDLGGAPQSRPGSPPSGASGRDLRWAPVKLTRLERFLVLAVASLCVLAVASLVVLLGRLAGTPVSTTPSASLPGAPANAASLADEVDPDLVDITAPNSYQGVEGLGTGLVLTPDGLVVTNNHLIEAATGITARDVGNGHTYDVRVVGYDPSQDVALLQLLGASRLSTVRLGSSSNVAVGDGIVALGNAEGAGGTPSYAAGSVTGIDVTISASDDLTGTTEQLNDLIQTNTDVLPGDSGGALVSASRRVVGMVTAGSQDVAIEGTSPQGYSIPIRTVRSLVSLMRTGRSSNTIHVGPTAFLGVEVATSTSSVPGADIVTILPDTPVSDAGLAVGDTIVGIGGAPVSSAGSLAQELESFEPGQSVSLRYVDLSGAQHTIDLVLASGPPE